MLSRLRVLFNNFSKFSKPKPLAVKIKEFRSAKAIGDDKAAKLSKSELENQAKRKKAEEQRIQKLSKINVERVKNHSPELQQYLSPHQIKKMHNAQLVRLRGLLPKKLKVPQPPQVDSNPFKTPKQSVMIQEQDGQIVSKKIKSQFQNYTQLINRQFHLQSIIPTLQTRRCGVLGKKLGMTSAWDQWGKMVPLTVIQLDRTQVVRVMPPKGSQKYWNVQVGLGEDNFKRITKPMLGHFMKHNVPPKANLTEFKVTEDSLLPQGYMISARHFTPGMFVDVIGKTVGHGFSGTIKRYRFRRQPATHGNSKTTRVLGSTGGRQDPGRVFKQKKMYGHMGCKNRFTSSLRVFKIDAERNLIYLWGSVAGKAGTIITIRDTTHMGNHQKNLSIGSYPTFIQKQGEVYARQFIMNSGQRDPQQIQYHDNAYILDDKEQDPNAIAVGIQVQTTANMTLPEQ